MDHRQASPLMVRLRDSPWVGSFITLIPYQGLVDLKLFKLLGEGLGIPFISDWKN